MTAGQLNPSTPLFLVTSDEIYGAIREWDAMETLGLSEDAQGGVVYLPAQAIRAAVPSGHILTPPPGLAGTAYTPKNQDVQAFAGWWYTHSKFVHADAVEERVGRLSASGLALKTVPVNHRCVHAYGVVLTHTARAPSRGQWGLAYSGDTIPSSALAYAARARGADVFLHEATMGDDMVADAFAKRHSTMGQALGVVAAARTPLAVLTHFSQRYPKLPKIAPAAADDTGSGGGGGGATVALSFDLMRLRLSDAWKFPLFVPALEMLYRADDETSAPGTPPAAPARAGGQQKQGREAPPSSGGGWTYLLWEVSAVAKDAGPPGAAGGLVEAALVSLHGQAGGAAVRVAVVHSEAAGGGRVGLAQRAVLRVARRDADVLASALVAMPVAGHRPRILARAHAPDALWASVAGAGSAAAPRPPWVTRELAELEDL